MKFIIEYTMGVKIIAIVMETYLIEYYALTPSQVPYFAENIPFVHC